MLDHRVPIMVDEGIDFDDFRHQTPDYQCFGNWNSHWLFGYHDGISQSEFKNYFDRTR